MRDLVVIIPAQELDLKHKGGSRPEHSMNIEGHELRGQDGVFLSDSK